METALLIVLSITGLLALYWAIFGQWKYNKMMRETKKIKAVLFDMDGVLIESHDAWFNKFNDALNHFGFDKLSLNEFDKKVWAVSFQKTAAKYFSGKKPHEIKSYFLSTTGKFIDDAKKMKNADAVLKYIKDKNLKLAVVTNTQTDVAKKVLARLKMDHYFDCIIGGDKAEKGKPDPGIIFVAYDELSIRPEEAIMVGDTIHDKNAAKSAGCGFIGYKSGDIEDLTEIKRYL